MGNWFEQLGERLGAGVGGGVNNMVRGVGNAGQKAPEQVHDLMEAQKPVRRPAAIVNPAGGFAPGSLANFVTDPSEQADILQDLTDDVNGAIADEMDARRAQAREQARMAHEQQMEMIRANALMERLKSEERIADRQIAANAPGNKKRFNPQTMQWEPVVD